MAKKNSKIEFQSEKKILLPHWASNSEPPDYEPDTLPLDHGIITQSEPTN